MFEEQLSSKEVDFSAGKPLFREEVISTESSSWDRTIERLARDSVGFSVADAS